MYISPECKGLADSIFTEHEQLYGRITAQRLITLLEREDCTIFSFNRGENNYGEFYFVGFELANIGVFSFYGLGENYSKDCFQTYFCDNDVCFANSNYDYKQSQSYRLASNKEVVATRKSQIITELKNELAKAPVNDTKPRSAEGRAFSFFEELMDADGAQSFLNDFPEAIDDF